MANTGVFWRSVEDGGEWMFSQDTQRLNVFYNYPEKTFAVQEVDHTLEL